MLSVVKLNLNHIRCDNIHQFISNEMLTSGRQSFLFQEEVARGYNAEIFWHSKQSMSSR